MPSLRELKRKVKSVTATQQITKAMKMVAAARLNRAQSRILGARPFADKMENLLHELAYLTKQDMAAAEVQPAPADGSARTLEGRATPLHPFMEIRTGKRMDVVLVTADRGLCGAFNTNLIRRALSLMRENPQDEIHFWLVGKKGRDFMRRLGARVENEYVNFFQRLHFQQAEIIGQDLIKAFLTTPTRAVVAVYNEFKSKLQQRLETHVILPIGEVPEVKPRIDFLYEPGRADILDSLFHRYVKAEIYRILLESQAAELSARMNAMESATDNAEDLISSLTLKMNKVRQAIITKEISEIVGGVESLAN